MPICRSAYAIAFAGLVVAASSATADEYTQYPLSAPFYPGQHSFRIGQAVVIPPYPYAFPVRIYTTPPQPPFYNVPPYPVVTPY